MGNLDFIKISLAFKQAKDSLRTLKDVLQSFNQKQNNKIVDDILTIILLLDSLEQKL